MENKSSYTWSEVMREAARISYNESDCHEWRWSGAECVYRNERGDVLTEGNNVVLASGVVICGAPTLSAAKSAVEVFDRA